MKRDSELDDFDRRTVNRPKARGRPLRHVKVQLRSSTEPIVNLCDVPATVHVFWSMSIPDPSENITCPGCKERYKS